MKTTFQLVLSGILLATVFVAPVGADETDATVSSEVTPSPAPTEPDSITGNETQPSVSPTPEPTDAPPQLPTDGATPEPSASPSESVSPSPEAVTNVAEAQEEIRLIVTYDKGVSEAKQEDIIDSLDSVIPTEVSDMTASTSVVIATGDVNEAIQELSKTPGVRAVSEDKIKKLAVTPSDTYFSQQWHLQTWESNYGINAESAWDVTTGSSDVTVAVLDTGKINHPDLTGKWLPGYDFVQNDTDPTDPGLTPGDSSVSNWHGTAIAGIIAGATNNSLGISGINWNSKIIPIRVGTGDGGYDSNIINGIRWAAGLSVSGTATVNENPADVINISWGGTSTCSTAYQDAINAAEAAGSLVVVAAGNGDTDGNPMDADNESPANCQKVLTVSASNESGTKTSWANYGDVVDVMAPGENDLTTSCSTTNSCSNNYAYTYVDGTSFSAPIVAGVASLMLSVNPALTPSELESLIKGSVNTPGYDYYCDGIGYNCGTGIIDASAAVQNAISAIDGLTLLSSKSPNVTLPLTDDYQDSASVDFVTTSGSTASITILNNLGNDTNLLIPDVTPTVKTSATFGATVEVTPEGLNAGTYTIRVTQGLDVADQEMVISSGVLSTITISKSSNAVYPYADGYLDSATITVIGKDSLGNEIPVIGTVVLNKVSVSLTLTKNTATWNWAKIPKGTREIVASGVGPMDDGSTKTAKTTIAIGKSVATKATIATNTSTVYPVKDSYLDSVSITFGLNTNTGKTVPGSGTISVYKGSKKVTGWTFTKVNLNSAKKGSVSWNGRVSGKVKPGKYKVVVTFKSSEDGKTIKTTKNINVSDKKRVLKTKKGSWYYAYSAYVDCVAESLGGCYYYNTTGIKLTAYGVIGMQSTLPFPVNKANVYSWRVNTYGWSTTPSSYIIYPCSTNVFIDSCDSLDSGAVILSGSGYTNYTWATKYSKMGISDGYADWMISTNSYADFYAMQFQVEVKYWKLE